MMKFLEAISMANALRPGNAFDSTVKARWINEVEGQIWRDIYKQKTTTTISLTANESDYTFNAGSANIVSDIFIEGVRLPKLDGGQKDTFGYSTTGGNILRIYPVPQGDSVSVNTASATFSGYVLTTSTDLSMFEVGESIVLSGCVNTGNNGTYTINGMTQNSITFFSFTVSDGTEPQGITITKEGGTAIPDSMEVHYHEPYTIKALPQTVDDDVDLFAEPPYDRMYYEYIIAKIDYYSQNYDAYNNGVVTFNQTFAEYAAWVGKTAMSETGGVG